MPGKVLTPNGCSLARRSDRHLVRLADSRHLFVAESVLLLLALRFRRVLFPETNAPKNQTEVIILRHCKPADSNM